MESTTRTGRWFSCPERPGQTERTHHDDLPHRPATPSVAFAKNGADNPAGHNVNDVRGGGADNPAGHK
jgi:hypothetical protein